MGTALNANTARFDTVTIFDIPMLFTHGYVEPETLPKGVYQYAVRHHSEDTEKPTQITDWAVVNRFGSLLSSIPIPMEKSPEAMSRNAMWMPIRTGSGMDIR